MGIRRLMREIATKKFSPACRLAEAFEHLGQGAAYGTQFVKMDFRKLVQAALAFGGQPDQNPPAVIGIGDPGDQVELGHAVDEFDGGVVSNEKQRGEIADRDRLVVREALDGEQRLMLLRRQFLPMGGGFAEGQEFPQLITELGQRLIVDG